jgi:hypothetical protein
MEIAFDGVMMPSAGLRSKGEHLSWLATAAANRLKAMRDPGENYSDVIRRRVEFETQICSALAARTDSCRKRKGSVTKARRPFRGEVRC